MAYNDKKIDLEIIHRVLPEYDAISKGDISPTKNKYKSIDTRTGDIYLINHPDVWEKSADENTRYRPEPELVMTYEEARNAALSSTASQVRHMRPKSKDIFGS